MFEVIVLESYDKCAKKLFSKTEIEIAEKFFKELKTNSNLGKPLSYPFLREKKISGKRIYFLVYDNICIILVVLASNKKLQQDTIDYLKSNLSEYKELAFKLSVKNKENKN